MREDDRPVAADHDVRPLRVFLRMLALDDLDVEGPIALTDGVSVAGQLFLAGFAEGFTAGMNALNRHIEREKRCL